MGEIRIRRPNAIALWQSVLCCCDRGRPICLYHSRRLSSCIGPPPLSYERTSFPRTRTECIVHTIPSIPEITPEEDRCLTQHDGIDSRPMGPLGIKGLSKKKRLLLSISVVSDAAMSGNLQRVRNLISLIFLLLRIFFRGGRWVPLFISLLPPFFAPSVVVGGRGRGQGRSLRYFRGFFFSLECAKLGVGSGLLTLSSGERE